MLKNGSSPVAVLGAGIAGVQAALDLAQLGHRVVLLERAARPGGKLAVLQKTFPTNDCSACALTPQTDFFCIRSPHFIKHAAQDKIALLTGVEVEGLSGTPGNFRLRVRREGRQEELSLAALILCPGFEEYLPPGLERYGYGRYPDVLTGLELEQRLALDKRLRRPSDGRPVQRMAFIQCAGSRDLANGVAYCSAVCCMYALKEALMCYEAAAMEDLPLPEITLFYMDMRTYGKTYQQYLEKAQKEYGLRLVRSRIHSIIQPPGNPKLIIRYALENGQAVVEEFDLSVLSTGLRPPENLRDLAKKLEIELDSYGFCQISSLSPVSTSRPGVFVAGAFGGPCDVIDAVTQGSAAAAACSTWLKDAGLSGICNNTLELESTTLLASSDHAPRIGVFICDCEQLSSSLDLKLLEEYGRSLPDVAWVQKSPLCNFSAAEQLQRAVKEQGLSRIIAAACSARALEPVITGCLAKAGLPGSAARVVNILDHAARIYSHDREFATKKAQDLVRMAAARVREAVVRLSENIPVSPSALVVGGGVAGMVCALTLGDLGYEVYLVEKEANLGGNARRLQRTLTGAEVQAWLSELTQRVIEHPRIHIYFGAKVSATGGKLGSFKTELEFAEGGRREVIRHGVTVLATGAVEKRPKHYLYGAHPAVVTGLELEELLKSQSQRLSTVRRVVFIQCVGSRDADHPYCSRTCCSETLKNALELKKINPRVEIYVLNRDVMAYGLREQLYEAARSQGVLFLRYSPESPPEVTANRKKESGLQVKAFDPILGEEVTINADLLVLAAGMEPRPQNARLASLFRVPLDENGFFAASHPKLKTVETPVPGIFTCGLAEGPKSLEEAVASAQAAAVKAAAILAGGRHPLPGRVAQVEGACAACLTCVRVCPYGAPAIKDHRSHIDPLLCQGCGACVAACPAGAITLTGYSQAELDAELRALPGDPDEALRTVVFTCSYCAYTASENAAGTAARGDVSIVQVPCLSRVGTLEILRAIEAGAEQIVLTGCVEGQCHFRPARAFGNERSAPDPMICQEQAWRRTRKILHDLGLGEGTIRVLRVPPPPPGQRHPLASCF